METQLQKQKQNDIHVPTTMYKDDFTKEEMKKVIAIKDNIKPLDLDGLSNYGVEAQQTLSNFSHDMLNKVQSKDIGPIGETLSSLMTTLAKIDPSELSTKNKNVFYRLFNRAKNKVENIIARNQSVAIQVDKISDELVQAKDILVEDVHTLDEMYVKNREYFDSLNMYIKAAEIKEEEIRNTVLPELREIAKNSDNQMTVQDVQDMEQYLSRLEKRTHDLKLSRQITLQSAPQIRMIQDINQTLAEKIQSSILTSVPLWKNQMIIALTLLKQESASKAQQEVTKTTNDLLLRNSEMLKQNSIDVAKENERGIIDVETLKVTQKNLVDTIEETLKIQRDGSKKREEAEKELVVMEQELKTRLLELKDEYVK